jgi:hypothetical protein
MTGLLLLQVIFIVSTYAVHNTVQFLEHRECVRIQITKAFESQNGTVAL